MRDGALNHAPQESKANSPEDKKRFDLIAQKDAAEQFLKDNAGKLAQNLEQLDAIDDANPDKDIARQMIADLKAETARRQAEYDSATAELTAMADAEIAAMSAGGDQTVTGDSIEDALKKAADKYGIEPAMELESPLETQARMTAAHQARQERIKAMGERVDARMKAEDDLERMVMEPLPEEGTPENPILLTQKKKRAETRQDVESRITRISKNNSELMKDIEGVTSDLQKAVAAKNFDVVGIYAKNLSEMNKRLAENQKELEAAGDKFEQMWAFENEMDAAIANELKPSIEVTDDMIMKSENDLDRIEVTDDMIIESIPVEEKKGSAPEKSEATKKAEAEVAAMKPFEQMNADERMALTPDQLLVMAEQAEAKEKAPSPKEAKAMIKENKLTPERKASIEREMLQLSNEIHAINEGIELIDRQTGKTINKPGLKELEAKLKGYGVDVNAVVNAKNENEAAEAILKSFSKLGALKRGLLTVFSPGYRKTMRQYEERTRELDDAQDRLSSAKLELKDPKKYASLMNRRLMKTMMRRASQSRPSPRPQGLFSLRG